MQQTSCEVRQAPGRPRRAAGSTAMPAYWYDASHGVTAHRRDVVRPVLLVAVVAARDMEPQALNWQRLREGRSPGLSRPRRPCCELQAEEDKRRRRGQRAAGVAAWPVDRARQLLCLIGIPGMVVGAPLISRR